jgi:hypothetical protein
MVMPKKAVPMCVVSIGYSLDLLLPTSDGMKLVEILQRSVEVRRDFSDRDYNYTIKDQPHAEFSTVKPSQVRSGRGSDGVISLEDRRGG